MRQCIRASGRADFQCGPLWRSTGCQTNTPALSHNQIGMPQLTSMIACHHEAEHYKLTRSFDPRGTRRADAQLAHAECNFMDMHVSSPQRSRTTTLSFSWYQSSPRNFIPGECGEGLFQHVADVPLPFSYSSADRPQCRTATSLSRQCGDGLNRSVVNKHNEKA
jgi:hypothetical protein